MIYLELLETYAPVLFMHPDEEYFPKSIDSMLMEGDLREYPGEIIRDSMPVGENNLDPQSTNENYYLDIRDASPGIYPRYTAPDPSRFIVYPETVYADVRSTSTGKALQYCFLSLE